MVETSAIRLISRVCQLAPVHAKGSLAVLLLSSLSTLILRYTKNLLSVPKTELNHSLPLVMFLRSIDWNNIKQFVCKDATNLFVVAIFNLFTTLLNPTTSAKLHHHSLISYKSKNKLTKPKDEKETVSRPEFRYWKSGPTQNAIQGFNDDLPIAIAHVTLQILLSHKQTSKSHNKDDNDDGDDEGEEEEDEEDGVMAGYAVSGFGDWFGIVSNMLGSDHCKVRHAYLKILRLMVDRMLREYQACVSRRNERMLIDAMLKRYLSPTGQLMTQIQKILELSLSLLGSIPLTDRNFNTALSAAITVNVEDDLKWDSTDDATSGRDLCVCVSCRKCGPVNECGPENGLKDENLMTAGGMGCVRRSVRGYRQVSREILRFCSLLASSHSTATDPLTTTPKLLLCCILHANSIYERKYSSHKSDDKNMMRPVVGSEEREFGGVLRLMANVMSGPTEHVDRLLKLHPLRLLMNVSQNELEPVNNRIETIYALGYGFGSCSSGENAKLWKYGIPEHLHKISQQPLLHLRLAVALIQMIVTIHEHVQRTPSTNNEQFVSRVRLLTIDHIVDTKRQWNTERLDKDQIAKLTNDIQDQKALLDSLYHKNTDNSICPNLQHPD